MKRDQREETPSQATPEDKGGQVQFKILISIIGFGLLMLILKAMGVL